MLSSDSSYCIDCFFQAIISKHLSSSQAKIAYIYICPTTCHVHAWGKRRYSSYSFSTSAVVSITPQPRFRPGERTPGTHCTRGWVGTRGGLDTEAGGKILLPTLGIEPQLSGRPARSQTLY
jgi:hypothetical protein